MDRPLTRNVARLETILLFALASAVFHPSPALAQSYLSITHNSGRCHYPFLKMAMLVAMIFCIRDLARA